MKRVAAFCAAGVTALLAACSSQSTYGQFFQVARQTLSGGFGGGDVTRAQAAGIPYASLGYRVGSGHQQILVLATDSGGQLLWTAASHAVLVTRGGRIVRSVGLPRNIAALNPRHGSTLPPLSMALRGSFQSDWLADFPESGAYGVAFRCVTSARGPASVTILGTAIATVRIDEACRETNGNRAFTNSYWIDSQSGLVWRSLQHLAPDSAPVETELFRPPG